VLRKRRIIRVSCCGGGETRIFFVSRVGEIGKRALDKSFARDVVNLWLAAGHDPRLPDRRPFRQLEFVPARHVGDIPSGVLTGLLQWDDTQEAKSIGRRHPDKNPFGG
jgi:hypothetical protein